MARKRKENKRANNTGSLTKRSYTRPDGSTYTRWEARVTVGYDDQGKQRRKAVYGNSQAEALEKLEQIRRQLSGGTYSDTDLTVSQYLERWLKEKARQVKPRTTEFYGYNAKKYITPRIGRVQLAKLTPLQVQNMVSELADRVGVRTANSCRTVLFQAMKQAVRWQLVPRNVVEAVSPLKEHHKEMQLWTSEQAAHFLDTILTHRLYALFYLAMSTGMRRGELLGLRWQDIQGDALTIRQTLVKVNGKPAPSTPKTAKGIRRVAISPDVTAVLEDHRKRQMLEREALGEVTKGNVTNGNAVHRGAWPGTDLVFTSEIGTPINPDNIRRLRCQLMDKAGVPRVRLHDLRHLHVSLLIKRGLDAKTIADRVGHTNASFTLNVYTHLFEEQRRAAAVPLADLLSSSTPPGQLN